MAKDDKGHGSEKRGANYGKLTDAQLSRRFNKLSNMETPTDAHADALELVVDERERRRGHAAPKPGRGSLPARQAQRDTTPSRESTKRASAEPAFRKGAIVDEAVAQKAASGAKPPGKGDGKSINPRGDTFKPRKGR
jgi:hypothetical protein